MSMIFKEWRSKFLYTLIKIHIILLSLEFVISLFSKSAPVIFKL